MTSKIDFALLLYDEFDGSPISDANILFRHEGRILPPIRKSDGFYVFCGLGIPEIELEISRPHYRKKTKRIYTNRLDPGNPVEHIRLMREGPGNFSDCQWLHTSCPPNSKVFAVCGVEMQIKQQENDKRLLVIPGSTAAMLVGRRFVPDVKNGETFIITQMVTPGVYLTSRDIPVLSKAARHIARVYLSESDSDGSCRIPVEHGQEIADTAYYDGGKKKWVYL
jgi:hypothetical protein